MDFNEKDAKKFSLAIVVLILGVVAFLVVRPVLTSIIGALVVAYLFMPLKNAINSKIKNKTLSVSLICLGLTILIVIPLWFVIPIVVQQIFQVFQFSQSLDLSKILTLVFPSGSEQFITQSGAALNNFVSKLTYTILNALGDILLNLPTIALHFLVFIFVFFFALRDSDQLKEFVASLSPFSKEKELFIVKHFKDVTDSVIIGQILIGVIQGALAGIGFIIFGVKNALVLTLIATFFSILPLVGPVIVWLPINIYLFTQGDTRMALFYLLYNVLIVSLVDNLLRSYFVSRRTNISPAIIFVGMIGGVFIFGIMGIIIGPLAVSYFLSVLKSYKDKTLYSLFSENNKQSNLNTGNN